MEIGLSQENRNTNWQLNAFYNRVDNFIFLSSVDENNDGLANRVDEEGMFELDGELLLGDFVNEDVEFNAERVPLPGIGAKFGISVKY